MPADSTETRKSALRPWLGALPALIMVTISAGRALIQASRAISGSDTSKASKRLECVETYSVTLANSEYYVPEGTWSRPATPQLATVVSGMVRNDCGEPLKTVTIHINVRDDNGRRGTGSVPISGLNPGEAKPFSKAWMGRITSYEIAEIR
jgi:hypothetical protein